MKTEHSDEKMLATSLLTGEDTRAGSFRSVLKNRSFLLLWLAQLLSQIVFNAANYGVIAKVTAVTHSTLLVGLAIVSFTLPAVPFSLIAGVYVDYLDKRLVLWASNALRAVPPGLLALALLLTRGLVVLTSFLPFAISWIHPFFILPSAPPFLWLLS